MRPLRTMADRVARSAAMLAAAAAAATALISQRRAAGEQLTAEDEERERQQQLQLALKGGKQWRRPRQRKQQQGQQVRLSAISGPKALIQSWKKHHKGVETRPAKPAASAGTAQEPLQQDAAAEGAASAAGLDRQQTFGGDIAGEQAGEDMAAPASPTAASANAVPGMAADASAMVVAAMPSWPYGPTPTTPVVIAMHLITSLLHLVATEGSLPPDASLALLRFSQVG